MAYSTQNTHQDDEINLSITPPELGPQLGVSYISVSSPPLQSLPSPHGLHKRPLEHAYDHLDLGHLHQMQRKKKATRVYPNVKPFVGNLYDMLNDAECQHAIRCGTVDEHSPHGVDGAKTVYAYSF